MYWDKARIPHGKGHFGGGVNQDLPTVDIFNLIRKRQQAVNIVNIVHYSAVGACTRHAVDKLNVIR